jgi:tetratricopeptide (TPR) repeat protein
MANALARSGRLEEAREYIGRALDIISRRTNIISGPVALHTAGFVDLQGGDYAAAHHRLEEGRNILERSFAYVDYSMRTYPLLVESILGPQWHLMDQHRDGQSLRQAWSISRRGLFWSWRFPNYWPHALRARGRAAWTQGRRQAALGYFSRSIQAADAIGAQYDLARACLDLAKVCDERREELTRRGQDILSRLGAVVPLSER